MITEPPTIRPKLCVLGCAVSGMAAARLAAARGWEVTVLDEGESATLQERAAELGTQGISSIFGPSSLQDTTPYELAVLSPGLDPSWALPQSVVARGVPIQGELEFAASYQDKPIVAITGTNGKTTTTELVEGILLGNGLRTVAAANYGLAFSQLLLDETPVDVQTLEVSSFQLELIDAFHPHVAIWLNFAPDHLDRHPSLQAYRDAKLRIFENQNEQDWAIINAKDALEITLRGPQVLTFSAYQANADFHLQDEQLCFRGQAILPLRDLKLRGLHNVENVMAALAAGHVLGMPFTSMRSVVCAYAPAPHRCELVATVAGREFINDSKATNVHATESALRGMPAPVVLILGGKQKGLDYTPLRALAVTHATHIFTFGEIAQELATALGETVPLTVCSTLAEVVPQAFQQAAAGQTILFSPATSSFDQFRSYAHRGDTFRELVLQLSSTNEAPPSIEPTPSVT